ncbi:permease [Candidatus Bathyarchaeota archaeon]|nr:permease [Candidatus Bathyarchaeota archaeon]
MLNIVLQIILETLQFFLKVWHWIVLGFLAAGLSREFVPEKWFVKMFEGNNLKSLLKASVLGTFAQFLPHSSLPLAISLFDLGASRAFMITFLVSTPWLCVVESLILVSFVGFQMFLFILVMTMVVAVIGGLLIGYLEKRELIESERPYASERTSNLEKRHRPETFRGRILSALHHSYEFFKLSGKWVAIGFLGAGITKALIPMEAINSLLGYSLYSVPIALGIATFMEITLEASVPIICSLYSLGASPGVVFTLLMAGVVTDVTEIGTIWTVLGKKTAIASIIIFSFLTIIFGYLINLIFITV